MLASAAVIGGREPAQVFGFTLRCVGSSCPAFAVFVLERQSPVPPPNLFKNI